MRNLITLLLFLSLLSCAFGQEPSNRDPRAVYLDGSRVIPATAAFRTQLGIPNHDKFTVDSAGVASYPTSVYASSGVELATKEFAESLAAQSSLRYYYQEVSDGSGRELLASGGISVQAYETLPTLTTTNYLLVDQFITATGTPNIASLNTGIYENVIYVEKFSGVNAQIVFELYKINTGSVSTLLATSASYVVTNAATQAIHCDFSISSTTAIGTTDRLYIRQYAKKTSAGVDVVLRNWYGGTTEGYFGLPISASAFARTDLSNITQVDALSNLGLASQTLTNGSFTTMLSQAQATSTYLAQSIASAAFVATSTFYQSVASAASLPAALDPAGRTGVPGSFTVSGSFYTGYETIAHIYFPAIIPNGTGQKATYASGATMICPVVGLYTYSENGTTDPTNGTLTFKRAGKYSVTLSANTTLGAPLEPTTNALWTLTGTGNRYPPYTYVGTHGDTTADTDFSGANTFLMSVGVNDTLIFSLLFNENTSGNYASNKLYGSVLVTYLGDQ